MPDTATTMLGAETAEELYEATDGDTVSGWTRVGEQHIRQSRWYDEYYLVIRDEAGAHWGFVYQVGRTEEQEMDWPWDGGDMVPLVRLYPHQVSITTWSTEPTA